ncbi:sulfurtransferase [Limnochorda pilosa]|uniref:Sulfurtransferase n=1 Tax=Limnochorda pilosa TaxID=1555112 RepID=A0A0K2SNF5_LIMPI|nr:sulfurtransferase [Limnochorda pilosa]BAS28542.1 thiosulfate sulfurtransferase [Limnochorda pilosa]
MAVQGAAEAAILQKGYAQPEALVTTQWVADHLQDPGVRVVESDEDVLLYEVGHVPGAVKIDWHTDLQDPVIRDYLNPEAFARLVRAKGISPGTTVVFYGDKNNWWACYAFWVFKLFGHQDCRIMDGGRARWATEGRPLVKDVPTYPETPYPVPTRNDAPIRAFREDVEEHVRSRKPLVDVRSPQEYTGEKLHMPDYPQEGALRGGHVPGARNVPWAQAVRDDGTFKSAAELRQIYLEREGLKPEDEVIAYCRIGERSSHTWFVLSYLLGFPNVRNYDGSWTEWGNLVRAPIER